MSRPVAIGAAMLLLGGAVVVDAPGVAGAHPATPLAQSVGRFVDGSVTGHPIEQLVDLADARATVPGSPSDQDPLDVTALRAIRLPLTGALQLPQLAGVTLGAANQVAQASADGAAYGASGAVANSGAISVGGDVHTFPSDATVRLVSSADAAVRAVQLRVGAVSALVRTAPGTGAASTSYSIASLDVSIESPLVAALLKNLTAALHATFTALRSVATGLGAPIPPTCPLDTTQIPDVSFGQGAVTLGSATGSLTIDLARLLPAVLGTSADLDHLAPNTDLVAVLASYLTASEGLAKDLVAAIDTQLVPAAQAAVHACAPSAIRALVDPAFANPALTQARTALVASLESALSSGVNPLAALGSALRGIVDIGADVVPSGERGTFSSRLASTPDQATASLPGQTVVRALEIDVLGGSTAVLALGNAAAGPGGLGTHASAAAAVTSSAALPTAVPAGRAARAGTNDRLPLALVVLGAVLIAVAAAARRNRGGCASLDKSKTWKRARSGEETA